MADKNLELLLRIIAQVDGLRDVEGLRESVESLDPALSGLADRARSALNPMNGLADSSRNFGESIKGTTQPLADLATNALKVTSVISALSTALGGAVYEEAKKFESAQLDLKKVLGGTQEELDIYGKKLNDLALTFGVSANALTANMAEFVQAGFTADEAINLVTQSLKLKVAGDLEAAESSAYLVRMLKGFGAEAVDSARYVDVLNEVSNRYATDVKQLAEGMGRVAPIAKQMGLSFEETAGVLTPMIESFGSGAEAAEAFKTGVLKLIDDAKPVKDALQSMGVAQTDLNGNLRSGKDILNDVMVAFQTTGREQKLYLTSQLVGIDQAPRMIEVFDNLNKVIGVQQTALKAAEEGLRGNSSAQEEVNIRLQSAETIANRSAESFRQLAVALGTNYRDEVKGVVDATGALARGFIAAEKAGSMDGLFAAVQPQLQAVEDLFRKMAANLPAAFAQLDFSPLTSAITDLGGEVSQAFQSFMGSIDLTTVDGLRQALQLIADSMAALIRFTAGAVDQMSPFFEAMGIAARFAAENADSISRLAGEVAGFSLTVNKLLPLLADMAAGTFSIIGTVTEAAFKIGLLVGAIKLLNMAGISVLPMLGNLALAIGSLNLSTVTIGAAFAGFPGVLLAVGAAAGTAGYAIGSVLSAGIDAAAESITGTSLGGLIYDLAEALGLENTEADKAKIAQESLARAREAQAAAAKKQLEAQREQELSAERARKAAEAQTVAALATDKANRLLAAGFQESGLIWDKVTGELVRVSDAMSGIAPASLTVKNALRDLGIDYAAFSGGISAGAEKAILSFKKITEDVTTNAPVIAAALKAAVNKAETVGDLEAISAAFDEFAKTGKLSSEQFAAAQSILAKKFTELRQAQDPALQQLNELSKSSSDYVRAVEGVVNAETAGIKAAIKLAAAKGDTAEVQRLTIELTKKEAEGAVRIAKAQQAQQEAEAAVAKKKLELVQAQKLKNEATSEDLELAELVAQKEVAEAEAAGVNTEAQIQLAAALQAVNAAKGGATESSDKNTESTEKATEAQTKQVKVVDNLGKLHMQLIGGLDGSQQRMAELSETAKVYFDAMLQGTMNARAMEGAFKSSGIAAESLNRALEGGTGDTGQLAKFESAAAQAGAALGRFKQEMFATTGMFDTYATALALAESATRKIYYEQAAGAERLRLSVEDMVKSGQISATQLAVAAKAADGEFKMLDAEDLSGLRGAIDEATQKLQEMEQATLDAMDRIAELDAELAAERGDTTTADRLKLELEGRQAIAEVDAEITKAQMYGNRQLLEALSEQRLKLLELYRLKENNLNKAKTEQDTENDIANRSVNNANAVKEAWSQAGGAIASAGSAMKSLGSTDLSGLHGQLAGLNTTVNGLRSVL